MVLQLDYDDSLPPLLFQEWENITKALQQLTKLQLPRLYVYIYL